MSFWVGKFYHANFGILVFFFFFFYFFLPSQSKFLGFYNCAFLSWVMLLTLLCVQPTSSQPAWISFDTFVLPKLLLVKSKLGDKKMSGWKGEETHTQVHFEMKNKLRYSLCWVVLGFATDNTWQFFFCRDLSMIHLE